MCTVSSLITSVYSDSIGSTTDQTQTPSTVSSLQPNCSFPVSQDKEEKCRHVLSYVLKASASHLLHLCELFSTALLITATCISQGLKAVDGSIKETDLPAADPNTPIPLKYDAVGACAAESSISSLLERGQANFRDNYLPEQEGFVTFIYTI